VLSVAERQLCEACPELRSGVETSANYALVSRCVYDREQARHQHHPHPTLPGSAIQASLDNPALRILLRALSGARANRSQTRRFTPLKGRASSQRYTAVAAADAFERRIR